MLPDAWRLQVKNEAGVDVDVELYWQGRRVDTNVEVVRGNWSADLGTTGLGNDQTHETAEQDGGNWLAATLEAVFTFASEPSGQVAVYFQSRGDGASDWPDDKRGFPVIVREFDATGTFRETAEV